MGTVTFLTRTQVGELTYEKDQVAALTARLEAYVLERNLAQRGGTLPDPKVNVVDFPQPPSEQPPGESTAPAGEGAGTGEPPATDPGSSPATGGQAQPPQAPAKKSAAKKTTTKQG